MVILDEVKRRLSELAPEVTDLHDALAIERSRVRLEELEQKSASPEFYDDAAASGAVFAEMGELKDRLEQYAALQTMLEDAETLLEMCAEDDDPALAEEADAAVNSLDAKVEELRLVTLLNGEYDANNAILTFHAGAGGTEAQDWVEMLYRMYTRFAARHNWTVKVLDYLEGDEAGIKSASILVEGHNAYGFLRSENGVHRLVRVSPFDASGRRHTSFASLEVMPELDDAITVEIKPEDIKMEVFRSSGAGGQHINKTSSAVRLIHKPSGIVVACQEERSQVQNREKCMQMLASKLYEIEQEKISSAVTSERRSQVGTGMRNERIRTYNFPQGRVTDHRIGLTLYKIDSIMDGDLDELIDALVTADQAEKLQNSQDE